MVYRCNQENCPVASTGICLEGFNPVSECPNAVEIKGKDDVLDIVNEEDPQLEKQPEIFSLYNGREIVEKNISSITFEKDAELVLLLGEPFCGKTTMFASLFDQFQKGPFAEHIFAGSKTLIGFEERCHLARLSSNNKISDTERTLKTSDIPFLHLAVREVKLIEKANHIIFADISGERFKSARDSDEEMKSLTIFKRATHIFFLVDGKLLIDSTKRFATKENIIKLIGRALQNGLVNEEKGINIIITKWDKIVEVKQMDAIQSFFTTPVKEKFKTLIKEIIQVASRSSLEEVKAGTGLDVFLKLLLKKKDQIFSDINFDFELLREFQRYKYRENG